MNVLHIVYAKVWGGGETTALSMCKTLQQSGHNVYVVISGDTNLLKEKFSQVGRLFEVSFSWIRLITCLWTLRRIIKDNKIDVIHTHTGKVLPFVIIANWHMKSKIIAYRHNAIASKRDFIHQLIYKKLDAIVCVSEFVRDCQKKNMPEWFKRKMYVVYNGVDIIEGEVVFRDRQEEFVVGYAGRIEENKGLMHLVKALVNLKNNKIVLKIAGDDNTTYAKQVKTYLHGKEYKKNVQWMGYLNDITQLYENIDVLVCPSMVPEAFGLSVCEAMYYGKPVITSNNGAQGEIIQSGIDGFMTNPGDETEIASRLQELYDNPKMCRKMGMLASRKIKNNYTMGTWLNKMSLIYDIILAKDNHEKEL